MQIVRELSDLAPALSPWREAREKIALVPTMGALHAGHMALVDAARQAGVKVVFVRLLSHPGEENKIAREAKARRHDDEPDLCVEGSRGADFVGPQPQAGDVIVSKTHFSAFARTGLADQLHAQGVDTLVLAGLTTECCVASSAWDGFEHAFHIFVAEDACAAYAQDLHSHALKALALSGATVASMQEFAENWKKHI